MQFVLLHSAVVVNFRIFFGYARGWAGKSVRNNKFENEITFRFLVTGKNDPKWIDEMMDFKMESWMDIMKT